MEFLRKDAKKVTLEITKEELQLVLSAASTDQTRYNLCGFLVDVKQRLLVATNGHVLIKTENASARHEKLNAAWEKDVSETFPNPIFDRESVEALLKAMPKTTKQASSTATFTIQETEDSNGHTVCVTTCETHLGVSMPIALREGTFPDYIQVIPKQEGIEGFSVPKEDKSKAAFNDAFAFNGDYMALFCKEMKRLNGKDSPVKIACMIDSLSPMRLEACSPDHDLKATFVLMPMRI